MKTVHKLNFHEAVWQMVRTIPKGKVATYGMVAVEIGKPRAARAVGNALKKNLFRSSELYRQVPCHRVIRSNGSVGGFARGSGEKTKLLEREGVKIKNGIVDPRHILLRPGK